MTWTTLTYAFGSKLTSTKMTQNQDNFTAMANGDAGAPAIQNAALANGIVDNNKIASGAVTAGQLSTSTGEAASTGAYVTAPGGEYAFRHYVRTDGATGYVAADMFGNPVAYNATTSTSYIAQIYLSSSNPGSFNGRIRERYINSSPPYDLGDGNIPLFIFLHLNSAGRAVSFYCAPDPPWAYNGPTDIRPDIYRNGKGYKRRLRLFAEFGSIEKALGSGVSLNRIRQRLIDESAGSVYDDVEITQQFKQADMTLIPHPFTGPSPVALGITPILLNPVSPLMETLAALHSQGESIIDLITQNYIVFNNQALNIKGPPGVMVVDTSWRLTL